MSRKLSYTPKSRVRSSLRQLWLRSRERAKALRNANYSCEKCGVKQSKAKGKVQKVEVHHKKSIQNWSALISAVYEYLLCDPQYLECLCPDCHKKTPAE